MPEPMAPRIRQSPTPAIGAPTTTYATLLGKALAEKSAGFADVVVTKFS